MTPLCEITTTLQVKEWLNDGTDLKGNIAKTSVQVCETIDGFYVEFLLDDVDGSTGNRTGIHNVKFHFESPSWEALKAYVDSHLRDIEAKKAAL